MFHPRRRFPGWQASAAATSTTWFVVTLLRRGVVHLDKTRTGAVAGLT
jgi:hypothetical protein